VIDALALFAASFVVVFALGLQQMNVSAGYQRLAFCTSLAIGVASLVQFKVLPGPTGPLTIGAYLVGSAFGIVASMRTHPALVRMLADWRQRRGLSTPAQKASDALGERLRLALAIAEPAAISDIERFCPAVSLESTRWYETALAGEDHDEGDPEGAYERAAVEIAVRFLDAGHRLIHHPHLLTLVRFKP